MIKETDIIIADPTGNITALVVSPVEAGERSAVASEIMKENPRVEQVGFIYGPRADGAHIRLEMMGGEFCGNASLSAAAWYMKREGFAPGTEAELVLEVSGVPETVPCRMARLGKEDFRGRVVMPLPERIYEKDFGYGGKSFRLPVVELPGITHIICPYSDAAEKGAAGAEQGLRAGPEAEKALRLWAEDFADEAVGLLFLEKESMTMTPVVLVKPTDTVCYENGCGTGTAAVGSWRALNEAAGELTTPVRQPGGVITAETVCGEGGIQKLEIIGNVRIAE